MHVAIIIKTYMYQTTFKNVQFKTLLKSFPQTVLKITKKSKLSLLQMLDNLGQPALYFA